ERRPDGVDELRHQAVGDPLRKVVEPEGRSADEARHDEAALAAKEVGQRAGGHLEYGRGDEIRDQHQVDLEEVEAPAGEKERIDGRHEPRGQAVGGYDRVVGALGRAHTMHPASERAAFALESYPQPRPTPWRISRAPVPPDAAVAPRRRAIRL